MTTTPAASILATAFPRISDPLNTILTRHIQTARVEVTAARRSFARRLWATPQRIVTGTGADAIPFAMTTRMLAPTGVEFGTVKSVEEAAPGAIETDVQLLVRA